MTAGLAVLIGGGHRPPLQKPRSRLTETT